MKHDAHAVFISAINGRNKLSVRFYSQEDGAEIVRTCAPFDFGPSRRAHDTSDRYHFWDYDSDSRTPQHNLSLPASQIVSIILLADTFDPADLVTWNVLESPWFVRRSWGRYS